MDKVGEVRRCLTHFLLLRFFVSLGTFHFPPEYAEFKELLAEAEQNQFSECDLLDRLKSAVADAEQCAQVANQLFVKRHKTR